jgi:uncharacterized protein with GYD domain
MAMTHYLLQVAYTAEGWATLVQHPHNRLEELRPVVARLGGSLEALWMSFGDYDVVALLQLPDHVSAAALSIAVSAGGAVKAVKTTPLMSVEEGMEAMAKAGEVGYKAPKWVRSIRGEDIGSEGLR